MFISCRYLVEPGPWQLGLPVAESDFHRKDFSPVTRRELTEPHWVLGANSVSSAKDSVSSLWHTNNRLKGTLWNRTLRNRIRPVSNLQNLDNKKEVTPFRQPVSRKADTRTRVLVGVTHRCRSSRWILFLQILGGEKLLEKCRWNTFQNCLQWGRSNLVDPAESPKVRLLNRDFGNILSIFPRKNSKTQSSLNFL